MEIKENGLDIRENQLEIQQNGWKSRKTARKFGTILESRKMAGNLCKWPGNGGNGREIMENRQSGRICLELCVFCVCSESKNLTYSEHFLEAPSNRELN